jgi:type II secretory pathway pseudopilin PulG
VRRRNESGAVLLEVIVALAILAIAGTSALLMASESARAVIHVREQGEALQAASAFMDAVALWPRADLDRRLGVRRQGDWRLRIDRPERRLYVVTLSDSDGVELIKTSLFRSDQDLTVSR